MPSTSDWRMRSRCSTACAQRWLALSDGEPAADGLAGQAIDALEDLTRYDASLGAVLEVLQGAQAQLQDAAHSLHAYLGRSEPDPARLAELDARLSSWLSLARRYRRPPAELPALLAGWKQRTAGRRRRHRPGRAGSRASSRRRRPGAAKRNASASCAARRRQSCRPR